LDSLSRRFADVNHEPDDFKGQAQQPAITRAMQALNLKKGFAESEIGGGLGSNLRRLATAKALPVYLQEPTYLRTDGSA
jgi:hypothetical protein